MIPDTSSSLLREIAGNAQSVRWKEFVARYRPMMVGYLTAKFTGIDYEDVIQETFIALADVLPNYRYRPDETGSFHNYLTAVLRNKACDALRDRQKRDEINSKVATDPSFTERIPDDAAKLQRAIFAIALNQVLNDESILHRNRRIFVEVAINGHSAADVADMFGVERNNVDQIKARILKVLQRKVEEVSRLTHGDD